MELHYFFYLSMRKLVKMRKVKQLTQSAQLKAMWQRFISGFWCLNAHIMEIQVHCCLEEVFREYVLVELPGQLAF